MFFALKISLKFIKIKKFKKNKHFAIESCTHNLIICNLLTISASLSSKGFHWVIQNSIFSIDIHKNCPIIK